MDVRGAPWGVPEDDPQRLFAAVNLERNRLAVLRLDLALGLGRPDQAVDPGVVDLHRQPEPRVGRPPPLGQHGIVVEEIVVCVRGGIEEPVDRLRLAPMVEPFRLDPRKLGQRIDQLGLGSLLSVLLEVKQARVHVAAIFVVEVIAPERFERSFAGPVDARDAALIGKRRMIAAARLDRDVRPTHERRDEDCQLSQRHRGSLPRPIVQTSTGRPHPRSVPE